MTTTKHPVIPLSKVSSSQIESIGHDPATNTLAVRFSRGGLYHYPNISAEQYAALKGAKSIGAHLGKHIKTPGHKFTRIE